MQEYIDFWKNYFNFSGRTSRRGYWMAYLFNFLASFVIGFVAGFSGLDILATIYTYAIMIPSLAIGVRRLRDAGKHWAWIFINLIPLVGQIIFIVMLCQPSVAAPAQNTYDAATGYDY